MIKTYFRKALNVLEKGFEIPKRLDIEVVVDSGGLSLSVENIEKLKRMLITDEQEVVYIYLAGKELETIFRALWDTRTFRPRARIVWPLSLKLRKPRIEFEIK